MTNDIFLMKSHWVKIKTWKLAKHSSILQDTHYSAFVKGWSGKSKRYKKETD